MQIHADDVFDSAVNQVAHKVMVVLACVGKMDVWEIPDMVEEHVSIVFVALRKLADDGFVTLDANTMTARKSLETKGKRGA